MSLRAVITAVLLSIAALPALAIQPDEVLPEPSQEARARAVGKELRCLVCQNQSIDDSDADLARDLRHLVRQRITAGDSDSQVKQYLVDRYGDYVLLNPPFRAGTLVLWLGPAALLLGAVGGAVLFYRRRPQQTDTAPVLSDEDKKKLAALLGDKAGDSQ